MLGVPSLLSSILNLPSSSSFACGTVEFIPNSSLSYDAPYENVKISISFKKTISVDKTVSKDYESSATVRNYK